MRGWRQETVLRTKSKGCWSLSWGDEDRILRRAAMLFSQEDKLCVGAFSKSKGAGQ